MKIFNTLNYNECNSLCTNGQATGICYQLITLRFIVIIVSLIILISYIITHKKEIMIIYEFIKLQRKK